MRGRKYKKETEIIIIIIKTDIICTTNTSE